MLQALKPLLPEIYLLFVTLFAFLVGSFSKQDKSYNITYLLIIIGFISSFVLYVLKYTIINETALNGLFWSYNFTVLLKMLILVCAMTLLVLSKYYLKTKQALRYEYNIIFSFALLGAFVAISSLNLFVIYIGFELLAITLYILVGFIRDSKTSKKAVLKYLIIGSLASGMMLYAISVIYFATGSVLIETIAQLNFNLTIILGVGLFVLAIFIKLALVPMHLYYADVLQGSSRPIIGFISTINKIVGFSVLFHVILFLIQPADIAQSYYYFMFTIALFSMFVGSLMAIEEDNLNRFIAYSSINNAGFLLLSVTMLDVKSFVVYVCSYCLLMLTLICYTLSLKIDGEYIRKISQLAIVAKYQHKFAIIGLFIIFTLAGVPPFVMFYAKFYVLKILVDANFIIVAVFAAVFSIFAIRYCLRVVRHIYFKKVEEDVLVQNVWPIKVMTLCLFVLTMFLSIFPDILLGV